MQVINVTDKTLERMHKITGMADQSNELCDFYTAAIQGDFKETYITFLQDLSKCLLEGKSLHRLTTPEDLYAFRVTHQGVTYNCSNDYTFIGSDPQCDIVIQGAQECALIIVIIPHIDRIIIIDPGTDIGFETLSQHAYTSPVSVPGKRVFGIFDIHDHIVIRVADNTFYISANNEKNNKR